MGTLLISEPFLVAAFSPSRGFGTYDLLHYLEFNSLTLTAGLVSCFDFNSQTQHCNNNSIILKG